MDKFIQIGRDLGNEEKVLLSSSKPMKGRAEIHEERELEKLRAEEKDKERSHR